MIDTVVMQGEMRGWHDANFPAPLPGRVFFYPNPVAHATG
jgi:hypothetical protein